MRYKYLKKTADFDPTLGQEASERSLKPKHLTLGLAGTPFLGMIGQSRLTNLNSLETQSVEMMKKKR